MKCSVADQIAIKEKGLEKLFESGYLKPDKVRIWLQSVVDKARLTYKPPRNVVQVMFIWYHLLFETSLIIIIIFVCLFILVMLRYLHI